MSENFTYVTRFTESGPYIPGATAPNICFHSKQSKMQNNVVVL